MKFDVVTLSLVLFASIYYARCEDTTSTGTNDIDIDDSDIPVVHGDGGELKIQKEGEVLVLTADNFDIIVSSRKLLLVEFYAPWCGHCKKLEPEYAKAAAELVKNDPPIEIAKLDATQAGDIAQRYDVKGYPTILLLEKGEVMEDYSGDRSSMGIIQFMKMRSDPNYKPPPKRVLELTDATFKDKIDSSKLILVEFYSKNCGICKDLAPKLELAAQELYDQHPSIPIARIDGVSFKEIADEYGAESWPVFKIFRYGRAYDYEGPRESDGIVSFMKDELNSPSTEVKNKQQLTNNLSDDIISIVGFFSDESDALYEEFIAAAHVLKSFYKFIHTFDGNVAKILKEDVNSVVIFKPSLFTSQYEESRYQLKNVSSSDSDIKDFIETHKLPLVGLRTKQNIQLYSKRPLCVIYGDINFSHDYRVASQIIRKKILKVANEFKDITFALSNDEEFQDELLSLGLEDSSEEINAALIYGTTKRFVLDPVDEFDTDILTKFLKDALAGKVKPHLRSQPVPKKNSGPVKKIVANNYEELVEKSPESVLLEFYAPWCGHCKSLDPIYKKLGKKYADDKRITIAQFDATANDINEIFNVNGFPTIYFLKAGDKSNPITFDGSRTLDGMSKFIDSHLGETKPADAKDEL